MEASGDRYGPPVPAASPRALLLGVAVTGACAAAVCSHPAGAAAPAAAGTAACPRVAAPAPVAAPRPVRRIATGQTGWFASPALVDLDGDGRREIVAAQYSTFVFDARGRRLGVGTATAGRVYAPEVVADLDGDGTQEIVVGGNAGTLAAYRLTPDGLRTAWTASVDSAGQSPEVRGLAAADLDGDGRVEVVATTTNTADGAAQVFVLDADGRTYRPPGAGAAAWPRYGAADATFNGQGNRGYGAYGLNVGIGNLDDDPQKEIVVTFDNHQINVFNHDGTSVLASPWFTNRQSAFLGRRMGWGQFIRWLSPAVERDHYHLHRGPWPDVRRQMWLQWTASPPAVADLDGDGRNEVVGLPNAERSEPYQTQGYAFMVLDGAHGDGARSARRHPGFGRPVLSRRPDVRGDGDWYPPTGIPAPTVVDVTGDARPEIVSALPDGAVYAVGPTGRLLWRRDYARGGRRTFASEVVAADLNRDGRPELVFTTYSLTPGGGRLVVLSGTGRVLHDVRLPRQGVDGNGIGVAAAPSIADIDADGRLEIVLSSFDHGLDVFRVPGSAPGCLPWPTGRGGPLRAGAGPATAP